MHRLIHTWLALMLLIGIVGCGRMGEDETATTAEEMKAHFGHAAAVRAAVISGDIAAARDAADWLADPDHEPLPPDGWAPYMERMRATAQEVSDASTLQQSVSATSDMADACGDCHEAHAVVIEVPQREPLAAAEGIKDHMQRHLRSIDLMWDGLIVRSDDLWLEGADSLHIEEGLSLAELTQSTEMAIEVEELANQVHMLGSQARRVSDWDLRARRLEEILMACAVCHQATGMGSR